METETNFQKFSRCRPLHEYVHQEVEHPVRWARGRRPLLPRQPVHHLRGQRNTTPDHVQPAAGRRIRLHDPCVLHHVQRVLRGEARANDEHRPDADWPWVSYIPDSDSEADEALWISWVLDHFGGDQCAHYIGDAGDATG